MDNPDKKNPVCISCCFDRSDFNDPTPWIKSDTDDLSGLVEVRNDLGYTINTTLIDESKGDLVGNGSLLTGAAIDDTVFNYNLWPVKQNASIGGLSAVNRNLKTVEISGSWRGALSGSLNIISGSETSTGSFGRVVATTGSYGRVEATNYSGDGSTLDNVLSFDVIENGVAVTSDGSATLDITNIVFVTTNAGEVITYQ